HHLARGHVLLTAYGSVRSLASHESTQARQTGVPGKMPTSCRPGRGSGVARGCPEFPCPGSRGLSIRGFRGARPSRSLTMSSVRLLVIALALVALGAPLQAATITLSGQVYDGHGGPLQKGNVYHAVGQLEVPVGMTLSAEEGVIVKFSANIGMTVYGALDFQG